MLTNNEREAQLSEIIDMLRREKETDRPVAMLPKDKVDVLLDLAEYGAELLKIARYSRARQLFVMQWRGFVIGLAATITALSVIATSPIGEFVRKIWAGTP